MPRSKKRKKRSVKKGVTLQKRQNVYTGPVTNNYGPTENWQGNKTVAAHNLAEKDGKIESTSEKGQFSIAVGVDGKGKSNESGNSEQPDQKRSKYRSGLVHLSDSYWINKEVRLAKEGKVFEGEQRSEIFDLEDQKIAIKVIRSYTLRNEREARNLRRLRPHTNVVTILHSDTFQEGQFKSMYIAMELCNTLNLEDYITKRKAKNAPFNLKQALEYAEQVVDAIHHIHKYNILHRDLKPSSILFSLCGKNLKICDFGLSKKLRDGCSVTYISRPKVGADGYRAPETYNEDIISKKADIFSLALVLCYLWSYGIHPFGLDPEIWNFNIKHVKDLDLSHLRIPLSEFAKEFLTRMLKFAPKERPTIDQVKNDLIKLDWFASLAENLVQIWNGDVKDHNGADVLPTCQLYRSPDLQDVIDLDGSDWLFRMNTTPFVDIGSLKNLTEGAPSGYLVTSSADKLKKLTKRLIENKLIAWIDINKEGGQPKLFALLYQKDYPELFGFLLPDPQILTSLVREIVSKETPSSQQPSDGERSAVDETAANFLDQLMPTRNDTVSKETNENLPDLSFSEALQEQAATPKRQKTEAKQTSPELIPWWIFTEVK